MCKLLGFLILLLAFMRGYGQSPVAFKYQAVVRNSDGSILSDQQVNFRISILRDSVGGEVLYSEIHKDSANHSGIVNLEIGRGIDATGSFDSIDWGTGSHFLRIELDKNGQNDYQFMGTSQLLSVPYALYAKTAGSIGQSSTNYYGTSTIFVSATDTIYKNIPGLNPQINVPANCTVLLSTTGLCYGTTWLAYAGILIAIFIDGEIPVKGGLESLRVVTDNTLSSGGANWSINLPISLSPGLHTIEVKAKSSTVQNETSVTIDNGGHSGYSTLTVTYLKN